MAVSAQGCGHVSLPQCSHTQIGDVCPDPSLSVRGSSVKYPQGSTDVHVYMDFRGHLVSSLDFSHCSGGSLVKYEGDRADIKREWKGNGSPDYTVCFFFENSPE